MAAVDPTYPLYPIACIVSSAMLLLVLLTNFVRQGWNLGVTFLCFWLCVENLSNGIDAVIWSDNADIKLFVYCDIVSRMQLITYVVKPMATLIITRRLYLIVSSPAIDLSNKAARRKNLAIEWTLGFVIPVLVAGPIYYTVQVARFEVNEGFGCGNVLDGSILNIILLKPLSVIPPLISLLIYYPRVAIVFYHQRRDMNSFIQSANSVAHTNYFRILVLSSIDILLTLPIGIIAVTLYITNSLTNHPPPFYGGWTADHSHWEPMVITYAETVAGGPSSVAQFYFSQWASTILAFAIFGLFGFTNEARATYWRGICTVAGWVGCRPAMRARRARTSLADMEFGYQTQQTSFNDGVKTKTSIVSHDVNIQGESSASGGERSTAELESTLDFKTVQTHDSSSHDIIATVSRHGSGSSEVVDNAHAV
ncbi:unnamed protein product [Peniophora sp. CBMAI 1063]|nr:unnamed protein product [Peniophora sp. CBMAI 1063]